MSLETNLRNTDFKYFLEYDYDYEYDCENHGCNDEGICRCGVMKDFTIVDYEGLSGIVHDLTFGVFKGLYKSNYEIFSYALDRLFRLAVKNHSLNDLFEPDIQHSYYGEELEAIYLVDENLINNLVYITTLDDTALVNYLLKEEYSYLLEKLEDCYYRLEEIDINQILVPNVDYFRKLNPELIVSYEKEQPNIIAILDSKYKLVDGYHRYYAAKNLGLKKVKVLVAEN